MKRFELGISSDYVPNWTKEKTKVCLLQSPRFNSKGRGVKYER